MRIVVGLGGNAILRKGERGSALEQRKNIARTASEICKILQLGHEVVVTHGNGPQVGNLLTQQYEAKGKVQAMPMDVCGAMTQGQLGYMIQQELENSCGIRAATVITRCRVDPADPAFSHPSKPVGPFYRKKRAGMVLDSGRGYRKVVPSPKPVEILEMEEIRTLADSGFTVIASGGGGVPVVQKGKKLIGVDAVIDKDRAAQALATALNADTLLLATSIDSVRLHFGKRGERKIRRMGVPEAEKYLERGEFAEGSMRPKVEASAAFVKGGGKSAIICDTKDMLKALRGKAGTTIR